MRKHYSLASLYQKFKSTIMKRILQLSFLLTVFITTNLFAQNLEGVATYKSQTKMDIELDEGVSDSMKEQIKAMLKKQSEKEFTLTFTRNESTYKEVVQLDNNNRISSGGMEIVVMGSGGNDEYYKNLNENRYVNKTELFGKEFLIKDSIESRDWKLTKETKNIGEYTCFKATTTRTQKMMSVVSSSETGESKEETKEEEIEITAWYTLQIPISNGPDGYGGLPGLILELNNGGQTVLCSKIVLNPTKKVSIKEPTKGKVVTSQEFKEITEKKMKEMNEQFQGDGRKGEGNSFSIKIGGQ